MVTLILRYNNPVKQKHNKDESTALGNKFNFSTGGELKVGTITNNIGSEKMRQLSILWRQNLHIKNYLR